MVLDKSIYEGRYKIFPSSKIPILWLRGLIGSALTLKLREKGFSNLVERPRNQLDLTNRPSGDNFFETERPEYVFLAAAKVGGIHAKNT